MKQSRLLTVSDITGTNLGEVVEKTTVQFAKKGMRAFGDGAPVEELLVLTTSNLAAVRQAIAASLNSEWSERS